MVGWIFGWGAPVAEKTSVIFHCPQRSYKGLTGMSEHRKQSEEILPGLHVTEADSKPTTDCVIASDPPNPCETQRTILIPTAGPSETEPASHVGMSPQQSRCPTPDQVIPRHDTTDSGIDLTHTLDLDLRNESAPRGMQEEPTPSLYVDRGLSPKPEATEARNSNRAHSLEIENESIPREIREDSKPVYVDRAVSPKPEVRDTQDWNRAHGLGFENEPTLRRIQEEATITRYVNRAVSPRSQPADIQNTKRARERLIEAFNVLGKKRAGVLDRRYQVQEFRSSLRHEREALNAHDAKVVQKVRAAVMSGDLKERELLLGLVEELQDSRDSLLPKEDDYDRLEDLLNREEWELKEMERALFNPSVSAQINLLDHDDVMWFENNLEQETMSASTQSGRVDESPLMARYLSRKGDAELLRQQLIEMEAEQAQLVEEEQIRAQIGLSLDADSRAILEGFEKHRDALRREIKHVEEDISRLQDVLTNKDVIFFSINPFHENSPEASSQSITELLSQDNSYATNIEGVTTDTEPWSQDPLLLSDEEPRQHDFVETSDENTTDKISTPKYVSRWLLHILRKSIPEIQRYKSTDVLREVKLRYSQEQLKDLVLKWWDKDESVLDFEKSLEIAATNPEQPQSPERQTELEIATFLQPILRVRGNPPSDTYTSPFIPPVQALDVLSLNETSEDRPTRG
jgi:hypothetical protein